MFSSNLNTQFPPLNQNLYLVNARTLILSWLFWQPINSAYTQATLTISWYNPKSNFGARDISFDIKTDITLIGQGKHLYLFLYKVSSPIFWDCYATVESYYLKKLKIWNSNRASIIYCCNLIVFLGLYKKTNDEKVRPSLAL